MVKSAALALLLACKSMQPTPCEVARVQQAVVGGDAREQLLALGPEDRAALVYLAATVSGQPALCSGVLVAERWILTAGHCQTLVADAGHTLGNESGAFAVVTEHLLHPTLDLMLLRASASPPGAQPLPWSTRDSLTTIGALVEIAGFGVDRPGVSGVLNFVLADVTRADTTLLEVDGLGVSGACAGDSGGPLLARLQSGAVGVVGILASGSQSCSGQDDYTRAAAADEWLRTHAGAPTTAVRCGDLSLEGRCFDGRAVYCEDAGAKAVECVAPLRCGFDAAASGYRCVDASSDTCGGVSELGECRDNTALRCESGVVISRACTSCGQDCGRSSASGRAECNHSLL